MFVFANILLFLVFLFLSFLYLYKFKSFYLKIVTYFPFSAFLSLRNTSQIYFPEFKFVFKSYEIINSNIVYIHTNDKFYILLSCNDNLVRFKGNVFHIT